MEQQTKIPTIPRAFIEHPRVKHLFYHLITEFDYAEKQAIYFHHFGELPVDEISELTQLTIGHITSVLSLYSERLDYNVHFFKNILPYNIGDHLSIGEMLLSENEMDNEKTEVVC